MKSPSAKSDSLPERSALKPALAASATNGTSNGLSISLNGKGKEREREIWEGSGFEREEVVRLSLQMLRDAGYAETAETLQRESGISLETDTITAFKHGILNGQWEAISKILTDGALPLNSKEALTNVKFLIAQQKYLELLEKGDDRKAIMCLRNEITPLNHNVDKVAFLSRNSLMMSPVEDIKERAHWDGAAGSSRQHLLTSIQANIPPSLMLPPRRFLSLLQQAVKHQEKACLYHLPRSTPSPPHHSLLVDHRCPSTLFPIRNADTLRAHRDEVWLCKFSNDGRLLVTAGRDNRAIIWAVPDRPGDSWRILWDLDDHEYHVMVVAWSPDDTLLLTSCEEIIRMWRVSDGKLLNRIDQHTYPIGSLCFLPDGQSFVSCSMDMKVLFWDLSGQVTNMWTVSPTRLVEMCISPDGKRLVVVGRAEIPLEELNGGVGGRAGRGGSSSSDSKRRIHFYDVENMREEGPFLVQKNEMTCVDISKDSKYAIINQAPDEIHLLDLDRRKIVKTYKGQRQFKQVIRSCFGGDSQNFIVSGSEGMMKDGLIYAWHRSESEPIQVLKGHTKGCVNMVHWNPAHRAMMASAGDDNTVRIWLPAEEEKDSTSMDVGP
ncbi:WD40 repeat-like protein [Atractiella rhizophila]|nr:WD40 repeat-like protein [Atractiella rhizophila]